LPVGVVLADSPFGDSSAFRRELRERGLDYVAGVLAPTTVWRVEESGERYGEPMSVAQLGRAMKSQFRKVGGREGGECRIESRFASCRVRPVNCVAGGADDEEVWLLMEMSSGETAPCKFWLATLPKHAEREQLVHLVQERHRTERVYEDLKGKLGLDHFEGRTYRGWHHHVTVALACFAFIVAERAQRHSPRPRAAESDHAFAATAPCPPVVDYPATGLFLPPGDLVVPRSAVLKAQ